MSSRLVGNGRTVGYSAESDGGAAADAAVGGCSGIGVCSGWFVGQALCAAISAVATSYDSYIVTAGAALHPSKCCKTAASRPSAAISQSSQKQ